MPPSFLPVMLTICDILQREQTNRAHIYLYRRGLFYQAFDYSAYLLCHLVYPFEVTSLRNTRINKRYYMVSFPVQLLSSSSAKAKCDALADSQVLRYTPSRSAKATLPESYDRWCLRYTPVRGKDATTPSPTSKAPATNSSQELGGCSNLAELLQDLEHELEQESLSLTAKCVSYELTLDDKASLCDWLVCRILKLPMQRLCPIEALDQLDKLQQELRQKLS